MEEDSKTLPSWTRSATRGLLGIVGLGNGEPAQQPTGGDGFFNVAGCCASPRSKKRDMTDFLKSGDGSVRIVPPVLDTFLDARRRWSADEAAACCTEDVSMKGPMGEFAGLAKVKEKALGLPSLPPDNMLMLLQYIPEQSTPGKAVYAREYKVSLGQQLVPLRQEFTVVGAGTSDAKICVIIFKRLSRTPFTPE